MLYGKINLNYKLMITEIMKTIKKYEILFKILLIQNYFHTTALEA